MPLVRSDYLAYTFQILALVNRCSRAGLSDIENGRAFAEVNNLHVNAIGRTLCTEVLSRHTCHPRREKNQRTRRAILSDFHLNQEFFYFFCLGYTVPAFWTRLTLKEDLSFV